MPACSVLNCKSRTELGIRLFGLPQGERNEDRRNAWITNINRKCLPTNVFVCEKHFQQDQFENNRRDGRRPLKYNAVPTLFDFKPEKRLTRSYKASTKKRKSKQYSSDDTEEEEEFTYNYTKCRACLIVIKTSEGHILNKKLSGGTLKENICTFIPELSESLLNDQYICEECFESVVKFIRFCETCLDSDQKLRNGEAFLNVKTNRDGSPVELETETYKKGKAWEMVERHYKTRSVNKRKQVLNECKLVNVENHEHSNDVEKDSQPTRKRGRPRKKIIMQDEINTNDSSNEVELITSDNEDKMNVEQKENSLKTDSDTFENQLEDKDDKTKIFSEHDYSYESFSCPECRMDYRTIKGIKNHLINFHKIQDDPDYACAECSTKFQRFQDMLDHRSSHGHACTFCDKSFSSSDELVSHETDHSEKYYCTNCGRGFEKEGDLTKHTSLHEVLSKIKLMMAKRRDPLQHECSVCGGCFPSKPKLKEHVKIAHSKLKEIVEYPGKFTCDSLNLHKRPKNADHKTYQNAKKKKNEFECSFCSQLFYTKESLVTHLPLHANERKFECKYCGIKLNDRRAKITHEDSHKSDTGHQFLCMTCFKRFPNEEDCRAHEAAHLNSTEQFNCCLCDLRFTRKLLLENHLLDTHIDVTANGNEKNVKVFKIKWQNKGELDGELEEFVIEDVCQGEETRPRYDEVGADKTIVVILDDEKITHEKS